MSAPTIISVTPNNQETDVVLGTQIIVLFSTLMNHASIGSSTFVLTGPGQTMIATPEQTIAEDPSPITGREYITGTFAFDDTQAGNTKTLVTFTPSKALRPDVTYSVLILGSGGVLSSAGVVDSLGNAMLSTYSWIFTTGQLNLVVPPPLSPIPGAQPLLNPNSITVVPRLGTVSAQTSDQATGADLTQSIDFIFPGPVSKVPYDPTSDILTSVEAILGDPSIVVPPGLTVTPTWGSYGGQANRKLTLTISGWNSTDTPPVTPAPIARTVTETPTGLIDGVNATFTISHAPNSVLLFLNGVLQTVGRDFTLSFTTLTLTSAPEVGDSLTVYYSF